MATDWTAASGARIAAKCDDAAASGTIVDSTSNANDGTVTNSTSVTQHVTGNYDFGIQFANGNNARASFGSAANLDNLANISICVWLKNTSLGTAAIQSDKAYIIGKGYRSGSLYFTSTSDLRWAEHFAGGTINYDTTDSSITTGAFQHIAMTYGDRSTSSPTVEPIFYVDGVAQTTSASGSPFLTRDDDSGNNVLIGSEENDSGELDSVMDELFVYSGILTSTDVNEIMDNGMDGTHGAGTVTFNASALTLSSVLTSSVQTVTQNPAAQVLTSNITTAAPVVTFTDPGQSLNSILATPGAGVSVSPNALTLTSTVTTPDAVLVVFITDAILLTSTLPPPSLSGAADATVNVQCLVIQSIVTTPDAVTVAIDAAAQQIQSIITDQTENVSIDAAAQQISTLIGNVVPTVAIDAPGQEIDSFLPQPSLSGAADATFNAPCLVMTSTICQPDVLLSIDSAAQVIASNLGLSAPTVLIDAPGQTLISGVQQPGVTVAPDISALQAIFSLPGVTITIPGGAVTFNAPALTMSAILGSVSISQIYREIAQARKHGQPRYVNKINALRRIAKRSDSTLTSKHQL